MKNLEERVSQLESMVVDLMALIQTQAEVLKQHSDQLTSSRNIHSSLIETVAGLVENAKEGSF